MSNYARLRLESDVNCLIREKEVLLNRFESQKLQMLGNLGRAPTPESRINILHELSILNSQHAREIEKINQNIQNARIALLNYIQQ